MKAPKFLLMGIGLLMLTGCVISVHPVYTDSDLIADPAFVGTFVQEDGKATWQMTAGEGKSYRLLHTDENGNKSRLVAHVANVNGVKFLDLTLDPAELNTGEFAKMHALPIHSIYRVDEVGAKVTLGGIDFEWLKRTLSEASPPIASTAIGESRLITAPTDHLQKFLVENRERFSNQIRLVRKVD